MNELETVIDVTHQWSKAYMAGDIDKILSFYAEDGMMMSFDGIIAKGRENIREIYELWQRVGPPKVFEYETIEAEVHGDIAWYVMKWNGIYPEPHGDEAMAGTAQTILKRQPDGQWLMASEIVCADLDSVGPA